VSNPKSAHIPQVLDSEGKPHGGVSFVRVADHGPITDTTQWTAGYNLGGGAEWMLPANVFSWGLMALRRLSGGKLRRSLP
jgi:hypothetical protein